MSYFLHKVMIDGSVIHGEFNKISWENACHDPSVARRWGHGDRCFDPVAEVLAKREIKVLTDPEPSLPMREPTEVPKPKKPKKPEQGSFLFDNDDD